MKTSATIPIIILLVLSACQVPEKQSEARRVSIVAPKNDVVSSLLGTELPVREFTEEERQKLQVNLDSAKARASKYPDSLDLIIWHGRRLAYLDHHFEAIQVYSDGLIKFPLSHRLRRHRGHRYITTRQINRAIEDFELAAFNSTNKENQIEPDGIPNDQNKALGNDFFNIYYHFGLAHYINGRFDKAVSAYTKCMVYSDNNDLKVATSYWLYMSALRIGNDELAQQVLEEISSKMKMVENDAYLELLLLFKGEKSEGDLIALATDEDGQLDPTVAYGIGNWYLQNGRIDDARNLFWKTLESPTWWAFGYIATEADINNMATSTD